MKRLSCRPKGFRSYDPGAEIEQIIYCFISRLAKASRLLLTRLIVTVSGGGTVLQEEGKEGCEPNHRLPRPNLPYPP